MNIHHIAIWVKDLETMRAFYCKYFTMECNNLYYNPIKKFSSYFVRFLNSSCTIELMHRPDVEEILGDRGIAFGLTHFAISVGSKEEVNRITELLRTDDYTIAGEPRTSGDGYYESVILDPEGNRVEILE